MDELTKSAHNLQSEIISAINGSHLPAVVIEYVLQNILLQIQNMEQQSKNKEKSE